MWGFEDPEGLEGYSNFLVRSRDINLRSQWFQRSLDSNYLFEKNIWGPEGPEIQTDSLKNI